MSIQKKDINFIERYQEDPQKSAARRRQALFIAPLIALAVILLVVFTSFQLIAMARSRQLAEIDDYLLSSEQKYDQVMSLRTQRDELSAQMGYLEKIIAIDGSYPVLDASLFAKVTSCTDANFAIQSYRYDGAILQLGANAVSEEYMPQAVQKLRSTGLFENIEYTGYTSDADGSYTCTIGCVLRSPESAQ